MSVVETNFDYLAAKQLALLPCAALKGIGEKLAAALQNLGINYALDLLFHLPVSYEDHTRLTACADLQHDRAALVQGTITKVQSNPRRKGQFFCEVNDGTGSVGLRFFHCFPTQQQTLTVGTTVRCYGMIRRQAGFEIVHPDYTIIAAGMTVPIATTLTPIYPLSGGLTQARLQQLVATTLQLLGDGVLMSVVSADLEAEYGLMTLTAAIQLLHAPPPQFVTTIHDRKHPARQRLIIEELLTHHIKLLKCRHEFQRLPAPVCALQSHLYDEWCAQLPFSLTESQQQVITEIFADLARSTPMLRLLQGDVGAGKTCVAVAAMLQAIAAGQQAVLMAPTELLAEQHTQTLQTMLAPLAINYVSLTGSLTTADKQAALAAIANGSAQVIIGTHALFQRDVVFHQLGLVVIDEQHRFGVQQRQRLIEKGLNTGKMPHLLAMSATPIPRTLAMVLHADYDLSILQQAPLGRKPITTVALSQQRRDEVINALRNACAAGQQAYWICTRITSDPNDTQQAVLTTLEQLQQALPDLKIGAVHGRLTATEKQAQMQAFKANQLSVLVATTVIEVGVDVPNATIMVIEDPEQLGLAQLHQLRGRVGRGDKASYCLLLYRSPLTEDGKARLAAIRTHHDGFKLAEIDLAQRGPGELLGTDQAGRPAFRYADFVLDRDLQPLINQLAQKVLIEQ